MQWCNSPPPGLVGVRFHGRAGYEPPHSKGAGPKTSIITVYALSGLLEINQPAAQVTRDSLPEAMKTKFSIGPRCTPPTNDPPTSYEKT